MPAAGFPCRPVSRRRLPAHPGRRAPVRPRQVRRISDLPLERDPESLLRRAQRPLRRRFPEAVLPPGAGPPGMARVLGDPSISPTRCCPPMRRCCPPWNRSAGARFTGIKPRLCLRLAELNQALCVTTEHRQNYLAELCLSVCPECQPPLRTEWTVRKSSCCSAPPGCPPCCSPGFTTPTRSRRSRRRPCAWSWRPTTCPWERCSRRATSRWSTIRKRTFPRAPFSSSRRRRIAS